MAERHEMTKHEADVRMIRWISLAITAGLLGAFAAVGYGCHENNRAWIETQKDCVSAGGSFVPTKGEGNTLCLIGRPSP